MEPGRRIRRPRQHEALFRRQGDRRHRPEGLEHVLPQESDEAGQEDARLDGRCSLMASIHCDIVSSVSAGATADTFDNVGTVRTPEDAISLFGFWVNAVNLVRSE